MILMPFSIIITPVCKQWRNVFRCNSFYFNFFRPDKRHNIRTIQSTTLAQLNEYKKYGAALRRLRYDFAIF